MSQPESQIIEWLSEAPPDEHPVIAELRSKPGAVALIWEGPRAQAEEEEWDIYGRVGGSAGWACSEHPRVAWRIDSTPDRVRATARWLTEAEWTQQESQRARRQHLDDLVEVLQRARLFK
jgi:hypothetical protein